MMIEVNLFMVLSLSLLDQFLASFEFIIVLQLLSRYKNFILGS